MKPISLRLRASLLGLMLALLGVGLWPSGREFVQDPNSDPSREGSLIMPRIATQRLGDPSSETPKRLMQRVPGTLKGITDRFVGKLVLDSKEMAREEDGVMKVRRVRLVRDDTFKYPLLRVEDELIRSAGGDLLMRQKAMVGDHVLVKPQSAQTSEAEVLAQFPKEEGAKLRKRMPASGLWLIAFDHPILDTVPRAVTRLAGMKKNVRYAEPDYVMSADVLPNDASFSELWGLHNTGQTSGVSDADIDAPEAWNVVTGSDSVVVAVIDSGIDLTHPDLVGNLWVNPGEIAGNAVDDDGNGYVDDVRGWDFVNDDASPQDDNGHGSHCAGTVGAVGSNGVGVAGVCWDVSLIGLKFLDASGNGSLSDGVEAISYATGLGVTLTSNSWTGGDYSQVLKDVIDAADVAGILFVAAAGNDAVNNDGFLTYPASYESANILAVAATTRTDALAAFSNYGEVSTDLGAPGQDILSTIPGGGYGYNSGTSMAAPHVSGACALLKSFKPALTHAQVRELILSSVDVIPALTAKTVTGGRLNVYSALLASDDILVSPGLGFHAKGPVGGPFTPSTQVYTLTNHSPVTADWTASVNRPWVTLSLSSGSLLPGQSVELTASLNHETAGLLAGNQSATLGVQNLNTNRTQTRLIQVQVVPPPVHRFDLNVDPGWSRSGEWAYGTPTGMGGGQYGRPDPTSGFTGSQVFGVNLNGNYDATPGPGQYLTAGPFDFSGHHDVQLRFHRWLNSDFQTWVYATVEISTDGANWNTVWSNGTTPHVTTLWTQVVHDISDLADGQSQVYVRWGHRVETADAYAYAGWNIDDVELLAVPNKQLRLTLPPSVTEGGSAVAAKITASPVLESDLQITLQSSRPGQEVSVPEVVVIPAGAEEVFFNLASIQDAVVDGTQSVVITASAPGYPAHAASVLSHDDEQGELVLVLPASLSEGAGTVTHLASVSLSAPAVVDIVIGLTSSDPGDLTVPSQVTLMQGQSSVSIPLTALEDGWIEGAKTVTITASVINWQPASASLQIIDNESLQLSVQLPPMKLESAGLLTAAGQVSTAGILVSPLTVTLMSDDETELKVPAQVTIPAGSASVSFDLDFQDDALVDEAQNVEVTASAAGFQSGGQTICVSDDEIPALPIAPVPAMGLNPAHPDTDLAWQIDLNSGGIPTSFDVFFGTQEMPTELLGSTASLQWTLPRLNANTVYHWRIVSTKGGLKREGPVWSFTTPPLGPLHHLGWDPLPPAVIRGESFAARVTALDAFENAVTTFTGQSQFRAIFPQAETTTGAGTFAWYYPLASYYHDARSQSIYTPAEIGPAGRVIAMALNVSAVPGQTLRSFTLRLKHTAKTDYVSGGATWEAEGWTVVFAQDQTLTSTGWAWFHFTTPFDYDGTSNLMVDLSFDNNSYTADGQTRTTIIPNYRTLAYRTDSAFGDPLTWSGSTPSALAYNGLPNLRVKRAEVIVPVTPELSTPFMNGTWSGSLTVNTAGMGVRLESMDAADSSIAGLSSSLDVVAVNDFALGQEPLFTGGASNTLVWNALGAGYEYEVQWATQADFSDAFSTGFVGTTQHLFSSLVEGQLYHYRGRARASGLTGVWSTPQRSTQDATPPSLSFTPLSGGLTFQSSAMLTGVASDLSGISTLTINGSAASSSDAFASWNQMISALAEGENTFSIVAQDQAVPANVNTLTWKITRISDVADDADHNGLPALLEYAFHGENSGVIALPTITTETLVNNEARHLNIRFRRLIVNPSGIQYVIETSPNLRDWTPAGDDAETLSVAPTGDGATETVTVRLHPAISPTSPNFVRVRVVVP